MTSLALIPARAGSKGVPRKNIKSLCGRPLLWYTISAAVESDSFDQIVVSTDSPEIAEIAIELGASVPFLRPESLSGDLARASDVILHALDSIGGVSDLMYLQPTSPLRTARHIREAYRLREAYECEAIVSVTRAKKPRSWYVEKTSLNLLARTSDDISRNRQEAVGQYVYNGAVYLAYTEYIIKQRGFIGNSTGLMVMPAEESIDIDDRMDWILCECLMEERMRNTIG